MTLLPTRPSRAESSARGDAESFSRRPIGVVGAAGSSMAVAAAAVVVAAATAVALTRWRQRAAAAGGIRAGCSQPAGQAAGSAAEGRLGRLQGGCTSEACGPTSSASSLSGTAKSDHLDGRVGKDAVLGCRRRAHLRQGDAALAFTREGRDGLRHGDGSLALRSRVACRYSTRSAAPTSSSVPTTRATSRGTAWMADSCNGLRSRPGGAFRIRSG